MGIQGLLPVFKSISQSTHISEYAGKKVAIDTYGWLHKGALSCSRDLCQGRPTHKYVDFCMHRVRMLKHSKVIPILVFDGGPLPGKLEEESRREMSRKENLAKAIAHEESGNHSAAYECYQKAVDITPAHALRLIKVLQEEKIDYIVAPYEADAQLAYLAINGLVDAVITEDSDLLAHGCPKVLYKMDKFGNGMQILYSDLVKTKELCFTNFTQQMVLEMCIFSGCDYLASLPGMGVKRAHALVKRFKNFRKAIKWLKFQGTDIPPGYEDAFHRAVLTFKHQRVFDPVSQRAVFLTEPYGSDVPENLDFVGPPLPPEMARAIAAGQICPISRTPFEEPKPVEKGTSASKRKRKADVLPERNTMHRYLSVNTSTSAKKPFKQPRTAGAADPPRTDEKPEQPEPEEPAPRALGDDFDEWNRIPSASLPDSEDLDELNGFRHPNLRANAERRQGANAFEFDLNREAPLASLDFDSDLELDNPFEAFRRKARKSPGRKGPADLFGSFENDWATDDALPAKPAIDSQRRTPLYDSGRREPRADLQQLVESARETENEGLGFGDRSGESSRGSDRRAAALQPVRLPDLNRGAVGRREAARKTSSFFKQPAAAAERFEESAGVAGVRVGLGRMGDDDGNGQELGELKARDESPLENNGIEEENNQDRSKSRGFVGTTRGYQLPGHDDGDEERQGQGYTKSLEHLEAYSSTAAKAMEGLVAKLRTFKYIPSSSRQSALRNPLGNKMRNAFPR